MEDIRSDKEVLLRKVLRKVRNTNDLAWIISELNRRYMISISQEQVMKALNNMRAYAPTRKVSKPGDEK